MRTAGRLIVAVVAVVAACSGAASDDSECGPTRGVVSRIVDGDTMVLASGERVRYLMIDTPELGGGGEAECFADSARRLNAELVLGREVELRYDVQCEDRYGRLLAYVSAGGVEVNRVLVERGYACTLHVPPNGDERRDEFRALESQARQLGRGMWGACDVVACERPKTSRNGTRRPKGE